MKIPPIKINFPEESVKNIVNSVKESFKTGNLTLNKNVKALEEAWKTLTGTKYAIATNSGTSSIELPLRALLYKDQPEDWTAENKEIIIPANTFIATASAVRNSYAKPILVDVTENLVMDPEDLKKKITDKTKGVIYVHIGGYVSKEILEIKKICEENNLFLIEDAAHAHGTSYEDKKTGTFGDAASFSFYPTKIITSGEGGMIVTDNEEINKISRMRRDQGKLNFSSANWEMFGNNYRMSEIHAAIGIAHTNLLKEFIKERNSIAKVYDKELESIKGIIPLKILHSKSNYYKYIVFLDNIDKQKFKQNMKELGVSLSGEVYETPLHLQKAFLNFGYKKGDFPIAEKVCNKHVCLPIYNGMSTEEINYVIDCIKKTLEGV